jgi:hypothetical protein
MATRKELIEGVGKRESHTKVSPIKFHCVPVSGITSARSRRALASRVPLTRVVLGALFFMFCAGSHNGSRSHIPHTTIGSP